MTTQTMAEKILSAKTEGDVLPNDMMVVPADLAFAQTTVRFRSQPS